MAQQLVVTSWSILFAIVVLVRAFGWTGGKTLVTQSYTEARQKTSEQSAARKARRHAKRDGEAQAGTEARARGRIAVAEAFSRSAERGP